MHKSGTMKQDAGPYAKGTVVSTDPKAELPAVYVDPGRFGAWEEAGLLKSVKADKPAPEAAVKPERLNQVAPDPVLEKAADFAEAVTGEAPNRSLLGVNQSKTATQRFEVPDASTFSDPPIATHDAPSDAEALKIEQQLAEEEEEPHG